MKALVTGSSGHLGEALTRELTRLGHDAVGLDIVEATTTAIVGSITNSTIVRDAMVGADAVFHTATLHKPHVTTHSVAQFIDVNITGTRCLLEAAVACGVSAFVFTSTTSAFGNALRPDQRERAVWVTEDLPPIPRNIYGVTKTCAEDLCQLFRQDRKLACVVLRTSRFFPEQDDMKHTMPDYDDANIKANEYLYRRVDTQDVVDAHLLAAEHAPRLNFERFIISATTPFDEQDTAALIKDAPAVVSRYVPDYAEVYAQLGWRMFPTIGRVYVNAKARRLLDWRPRYDFRHALDALAAGRSPLSPLARTIGYKGYHPNIQPEDLSK